MSLLPVMPPYQPFSQRLPLQNAVSQPFPSAPDSRLHKGIRTAADTGSILYLLFTALYLSARVFKLPIAVKLHRMVISS